jgi:hypothetical protein
MNRAETEQEIKRLHAQADARATESGRLRILADEELERASECRRQADALRGALNREQGKIDGGG